jgi:hypothetical protein
MKDNSNKEDIIRKIQHLESLQRIQQGEPTNILSGGVRVRRNPLPGNNVYSPIAYPSIEPLAEYSGGRQRQHARGGDAWGDAWNLVKKAAPVVIKTVAENPELLAGLGRKKRHYKKQEVGGDAWGDAWNLVKKAAPVVLKTVASNPELLAGLGRSSPTRASPRGIIKKKGIDKRKIRGQLISRLMREHGMTLGEASRHIKQHGLY